jgi:hypothetical protein
MVLWAKREVGMSGPVGHARYCRIRIRSRITGSWQYGHKYMQWLTSDSHVNSENMEESRVPLLGNHGYGFMARF